MSLSSLGTPVTYEPKIDNLFIEVIELTAEATYSSTFPCAGTFSSNLERIIERISRARSIDEIVVATTINQADEPIIALCRKLGVKFFRGSENDVLDRVLKAAQSNGADLICELMGDSPLIDPAQIDKITKIHLADNNDYTSNFYPEQLVPAGFPIQIFSTKTLEKVASLTDDPIDHVHVSCYIYHHPEIFKCGKVITDKDIIAPDMRLCVDTKEDYELVSRVFEILYKQNLFFECKDVINYLKANPELLSINKHVRQKTLEEG